MAKKVKQEGAAAAVAPATVPRLWEHYVKTVRPQLGKSLNRENPHAIPRLVKVVVNMGVGVAVTEKKFLEEAISALAQVTGQKPIATLSKAAVSGFKLRENLPIGCKVTLRGRRMYEFLDRLVSLALPRVRDFRGLSSTAFDGHGNYSLGLSEQMVFPEINPDKFTRPQGMNITLVTSATSDDDAREFLRAMGLPLTTRGPRRSGGRKWPANGAPDGFQRADWTDIWQANQRSRPPSDRRSSRPASCGAACSAAAPVRCTASSACAAFVSGSWPTRAAFPV
jgi:large subunit ribosomal protein L5